jgi:ribonucleoside-diphosphate reductase beta chain
MNKKSIFNSEGNNQVQIFEGNHTGIAEISKRQYPWSKKLWETFDARFWTENDIDFSSDAQRSREKMSDVEYETFLLANSNLVALDTVAPKALMLINQQITAPEVNALIGRQISDEYRHEVAYGKQADAVIPKEDHDKFYNYWKYNSYQKQRLEQLSDVFSKTNNSIEDTTKSIATIYALEGIMFYNTFAYFYILANRGIIKGSAENIRFINFDERNHLALHKNIILEANKEKPNRFREEMIIETIRDAVDLEIALSTDTFKTRIEGITPRTVEAYTKFLANRRLQQLNLPKLYPDKDAFNPYRNALAQSPDNDLGGQPVKSNFFTGKVNEYQRSEFIDDL